MAYGLKYFYDFADTKPETYRVNLYVKDYTGDAAELQAGASPFIAENSASDKYEAINGTVFSMEALEQPAQFVGQPDFFLIDIFPSNERSIYFELRRDPSDTNVLLHKGWLVAPKSGVSIKGGQQMLRFSGACGLSQLKNESFTGLTGRMSFLSAIQNILLKTGLDLPFRIATSWTWTDLESSGNVFESKFHTEAFISEGERPKSCSYVLQQILEITNCEIFQEDGHWSIRNIELARSTSATYKTYTKEGAFVSDVIVNQTLDTDNVNLMWDASSQQQIESSIRTFTANIKSGKYANFLLNGRFLDVKPFINSKQYFYWDNTIEDSRAYVGQFHIEQPVREPQVPSPNNPPEIVFPALAALEEYYAGLLDNVQQSEWTPINQNLLNQGYTLELVGKFKASGGNMLNNPVNLPISIKFKTDTNGIYYYTPNKQITSETRYSKSKSAGGIFHFIPYTPDFDAEDKKTFTIKLDESLSFPKVFNYFTDISIGIHPPVLKNGDPTGEEYIDVYFCEVRLKSQGFEETHEVKNANAASFTESNLSFDFGLGATTILENTAVLVNPDEDKSVEFTSSMIVDGVPTQLRGNPAKICLTLRAEQYQRPTIVYEGDIVTNLGSSTGAVKWSSTIFVSWMTGSGLRKFKLLRRRYDFRKRIASVKAIELL